MRITACLAWYDEPVGHLDRCVRSLAGLADELIAVDGAWKLFPDGRARSNENQHATIIDAAVDSGIHVLFAHSCLWTSQVEKRNAMMQLATRGERADWLLVIDADEEVTSYDREQLDVVLSGTSRDVATITCQQGGTTIGQIRRLYRAAKQITVHNAHNGYRTADGKWLHGDPTHVALEPTVAAPIELVHHANSRSEQRNQQSRDYRARRRAERAEQWPIAASA